MNIQSIILLGAFLTLAGVALFLYIKKKRRSGMGCDACTCDCALRNISSASSTLSNTTPQRSAEHDEHQCNACCSKQ